MELYRWPRKIFSTLETRGGLRLWFQLALSFIGILLFIEVADEVMDNEQDEELTQLDRNLLQFFAAHRSPLLTQAMTDITALGSLSVVLTFALMTITLLLNFRDRLGVYHFLTVLGGTAVIPRFLKNLFDRQRPDVVEALAHVSDSSFPSGHAFTSAAVYLTLAFFVSRYRRSLRFEGLFTAVMITIICLVGFSRMYLGVHYPSDVFAGLCAGSAWSFVVASFFMRYYQKPDAERDGAPYE